MAAGQLNRERRALLGAALALPLVPRGAAPQPAHTGSQGPLHQASPGPPPRAGEEWNAALAAYIAAEAAVAGEEGRMAGASFADAEAAQEGYDRLGEAMDDALAALFAAPAPDVAALAVKLQLFAAHQAHELPYAEDALFTLTADALRLAGASPAAASAEDAAR